MNRWNCYLVTWFFLSVLCMSALAHAEDVQFEDCLKNAKLVIEMSRAEDKVFYFASTCMSGGYDCDTKEFTKVSKKAEALREEVTLYSHRCVFGANPKTESLKK